MMRKSPEAFRTISGVSQDLGVPKHVLKFWEGKFTQIRPMKRRGRRYYRPKDVKLLIGIRQLLYSDRYTIKGVQKILQKQGVRFVMDFWQPAKQGIAASSQDNLNVDARTVCSAAQPNKMEFVKFLGAYRTVSDVSKTLGVPKHVLKFWEGKFTQLRPMKYGGRQLYYRPEEVVFLFGLRQLLCNDRYTIEGVQKILQEQGVHFVIDYWQSVEQGNATLSQDILDVEISPDVAGLKRRNRKRSADYKQTRHKAAA